MKSYVHARLNEQEQKLLQELKNATGDSESELLRRGLRLLLREERLKPSALELAGRSAGKFRKGPKDLSTNVRYLEGFGR